MFQFMTKFNKFTVTDPVKGDLDRRVRIVLEVALPKEKIGALSLELSDSVTISIQSNQMALPLGPQDGVQTVFGAPRADDAERRNAALGIANAITNTATNGSGPHSATEAGLTGETEDAPVPISGGRTGRRRGPRVVASSPDDEETAAMAALANADARAAAEETGTGESSEEPETPTEETEETEPAEEFAEVQ